MNNVQACGNLTRDPIRRERNGQTTASFKLAVNRPRRRGNDGELLPQKTDYFWVTCWNGVAEAVLGNLKQGSEVLIDGSIDAGDIRQDDGSYKSYFGVNAQSVKFLRRPGDGSSAVEASVETATEPPTVTPTDDDIPF